MVKKIRLINWNKVRWTMDSNIPDHHRDDWIFKVYGKRPKAWELLLAYLWLNMILTTMYLSLDYMMTVGNVYVSVFLMLTMLLTTFYMMGEFQESFSWWVKILQIGYLIILMIWVFGRYAV